MGVVASSYVRTLFYLRYQQSSKPVSPSKNQPPPSGMSHSISMDVPNTLATRPPKKGGRVPRSKSLGEPGQLKMARHLAVPVDKHKVSRKKESKSGKFFIHCVICFHTAYRDKSVRQIHSLNVINLKSHHSVCLCLPHV